MRISDVLRSKGATVATVGPDTSVADLVADLAKHNIGAMVVLDGDAVVGIVSERDVVRRLGESGADVLAGTVVQIMTSDVVTCGPQDSVDAIASTMTDRRIRHMPVVVEGKLAGIVSIGDIVKNRISQLESDRSQLESYIAQG